MSTHPEVFIIETLRFADEDKNYHEGGIIHEVLRRSGKECQYAYIRTKQELKVFLQRFTQSNYRYLHISCHADPSGIETTLEDDVPLHEFCDILRPHLAHRRLFLSACSLAQAALAKELFKERNLFSILGPSEDIPFSDAAAFWPSLYHALFKIDQDSIKSGILRKTASALADVFDLKLNYYCRDTSAKSGYKPYCIARSVSFKQFFHARTA